LFFDEWKWGTSKETKTKRGRKKKRDRKRKRKHLESPQLEKRKRITGELKGFNEGNY